MKLKLKIIYFRSCVNKNVYLQYGYVLTICINLSGLNTQTVRLFPQFTINDFFPLVVPDNWFLLSEPHIYYTGGAGGSSAGGRTYWSGIVFEGRDLLIGEHTRILLFSFVSAVYTRHEGQGLGRVQYTKYQSSLFCGASRIEEWLGNAAHPTS